MKKKIVLKSICFLKWIFLGFWNQLGWILAPKLRPQNPVPLDTFSSCVQGAAKKRPRGRQECPKSAPRASKSAPRASKSAPRAPNSHPRATKMCPGDTQGAIRGALFGAFLCFCTFFCCFPRFYVFFCVFVSFSFSAFFVILLAFFCAIGCLRVSRPDFELHRNLVFN